MAIDQNQYTNAMAEDPVTGKPMPKSEVVLSGGSSKTIQTHNAVSISAGATSNSSFIECNGFDKVALTVLNDASTSNSTIFIWSNDGVNMHGVESALATSTGKERVTIFEIKARYLRVQLKNEDTVAHVMSAWAYLKA